MGVSIQPPSINTASINTLLVAADQEAERNSPPEELQDKVHFIFNNLSVNTLQDKVIGAACKNNCLSVYN